MQECILIGHTCGTDCSSMQMQHMSNYVADNFDTGGDLPALMNYMLPLPTQQNHAWQIIALWLCGSVTAGGVQ